MPTRKIAVLGAGTAGLAASLALARDGHQVLLIESDPLADSSPESAFTWERKGISHFLQPHAFIPRGRLELMEQFGDVYASLIREGARDVDASRKLPGPLEPADGVLQYIAVRRPLIEWGFRRAVLSQPGIEVLSRVAVRDLRVDGHTVRGVEVDGRAVDADIVIDAMGRRSPLRGWLEKHGCRVPRQQRSECGVIYYSRYFRLRPGKELPDGPWLFGPRGDLGYMMFATFPGDNDTFAVVLGVPTGVPELKLFMDEFAFQAAIERIPLLMRWANADIAEAITPVMPMGGLQNTLNVIDDPLPAGLFPMGDALCHTDPVLAHGLSFSLIHALELRRALRTHQDPLDAFAAYHAAVMPALTERYELATALDAQRHRMWTGGNVVLGRSDGDYALFSMAAAGAVAMVDAEVFRVFVRRLGLLDSTRVLDENVPLKRKIETRFAELMAQPRLALGPTRSELVSSARSASESRA